MQAYGAQPGYPTPGAQPGYPTADAQPGYPAPGAQPGYPTAGAQPGYPAPGAQPGYPAPGAQPGYPYSSNIGYPPPAMTHVIITGGVSTSFVYHLIILVKNNVPDITALFESIVHGWARLDAHLH